MRVMFFVVALSAGLAQPALATGSGKAKPAPQDETPADASQDADATPTDTEDGPVVLPGPAAPQDSAEKGHAAGEYGGVVPGHPRPEQPGAKKKPVKKKTSAAEVGWIGFQPLEAGSSRVFVQLNTNAAFDQKIVGDELVVTIAGARLGRKNDLRPIDTTFFDTAVASVVAKPARGKAGVELHVRFKGKGNAHNADAHIEQAQDGFPYLYLDFGPAPANAPAAPAAAPAERAKS